MAHLRHPLEPYVFRILDRCRQPIPGLVSRLSPVATVAAPFRVGIWYAVPYGRPGSGLIRGKEDGVEERNRLVPSLALPLDRIRPATGVSLLVFVALNVAVASVGVVALGAVPSIGSLVWPAGVIPLLALGTLLRLVVGVGFLILWLGKLRLADVGVTPDRLWAGLVLTTAVWALAQAVGLFLGLAESGTVRFHPDWADQGSTALLTRLLSQVMAVALIEEISYRGYLLPQLYLKMAAWWPHRRELRLALALLLSQSLFALLHLPFLLSVGVSASDLPLVVPVIGVFGLFFSAVYLRTNNLFFAMGIHALVTAPTPLFSPGEIAAGPIIAATVGLLLLWPVLLRRRPGA